VNFKDYCDSDCESIEDIDYMVGVMRWFDDGGLVISVPKTFSLDLTDDDIFPFVCKTPEWNWGMKRYYPISKSEKYTVEWLE